MNLLKSYSMLTLFLIANFKSISAGNPFRFPTESSKGIIKSNNQTENNNQTEKSNQTENNNQIKNNNQTENNNQIRNNNQTENNNLTEVNIESFCVLQPDGEYNCVDPPGYPDEIILKAVASQHGILKSFFDEDTADPPVISTTLKPSKRNKIVSFGLFGTSNNMSDYNETTMDYPLVSSFVIEEEYENVCSTRSDHIMPRAARNTQGEFQFIVNHPKGNNSFIQKVQVGECVNAEKECADGEVFDARTECHQEFLEHKLVAVSRDGGQVVVDTFKFPSCCTCRIIKDR